MKHKITSLKITAIFFTMSFLPVLLSAQTWMMQEVGYPTPGTYPYQISIVNPDIVWTIASQGYWTTPINEFSRTTDGGANWIAGTIPIPPGHMIYSIAAIDEYTSFASSINLQGSGSFLYRTNDGGLSWALVDSGLIFSSSASYLNKINFWDAANGIAIGDPVGGKFEMYFTSDSGVTWLPVPPSNIPNSLNGETSENLCFDIKGDCIWFGTSKGRVFKSIDRGLNWTVLNTGTLGYTMAAFLSDTVTGIAVINTLSNIIYKRTTDGGLTWNSITPPSNMFFAVRSIPGTNVFLSIGGTYLLGAVGSSYSTDAGLTWTTIDSGNNSAFGDGYSTAEFIDINTGWAGSLSTSVNGGIYRWNPGILGIENITISSGQFAVYPNPATDYIFIRNIPSNALLHMYDLSGRLLISQATGNSSWIKETRMDVSAINPGIYMLHVMVEGKSQVAKVIIN